MSEADGMDEAVDGEAMRTVVDATNYGGESSPSGRSDLRVAMVGVGHWHLPLYPEAIQQAGGEIVGVWDEDPAAAALWGKRFGVPAFAGLESLLDESRCDFVVALPTHDHAASIARLIIERRLPCVIEKPLGLNASEIEPLVALTQQTGTFVSVPLVHRYGGLWREMGELRDTGANAIHAHFRLNRGAIERYREAGVGWMLDPQRSGGGALRNLGFHVVDLAVALGAQPEHVVAATTLPRDRVGTVEEFAAATLMTAEGVLITLETSYTHADPNATDLELRLAGTDRYVIERNGQITISRATGTQINPGAYEADKYRMFVIDTISRFRSGRPPVASVEDCWRAARLIDAIYALAGSSVDTADHRRA